MNSMHINKNTVAYLLIAFLLLFMQDVITPKFDAVNLIELDLADETARLSSGSIINQLVWPVTFILGFLFLIFTDVKINDMHYSRIKVDVAILVMICVYLVLGAVLSNYPSLSLKRSLFFMISLAAIGMIILSQQEEFDIWNVYFLAFIPVVFLDVISVVLYNGLDLEGNLRGIHGQKNITGMIYSIFAIYFYNLLYLSKTRIVKVMFIISLVLLFFTVSKTSIAMTLIFIFLHRYLGHQFLIKLIAGILLFSVVATVLYTLSFFDVDPLFITGRGEIWDFVRSYLQNDLFMGVGYGAFWGVGDSAFNVRYGEGYIALINQAHNGYLDVILAGGFILLLLSTIFIFRYLALNQMLSNYKYNIFCTYIVFFLVFGNLTESTIFYPQRFLWIIFIVSYFTLVREYLLNGVRDEK